MLLSIDEKDSRPIYQQLVSQVREQVSKGILKPGDELPSVRELAESLGVNMHTVRSAYLRLRDQGIISLRLGRRARITGRPAVTALEDKADLEARFRELVADARLAGLSPEDIRNIIEKLLKESEEGQDR